MELDGSLDRLDDDEAAPPVSFFRRLNGVDILQEPENSLTHELDREAFSPQDIKDIRS